MPFIGNQLTTSFQNVETQTITGDGSTGYTLNNPVADGKDLLVYINNVKQEEGSGKSYTATGTTITFTEAVASTDSCYVVFIGQAIGTVTPKDGSIVSSMLANANLEMPNTLDLNGKEFFLDADADTSITADTDDTIDIKIAGADDFQFTANTFTALSGSTIAAQALTATTIGATGVVTANAGVVVDNITIDGTEIDLSSGDLTLDIAGDLVVNADGGNFVFQDDSVNVGELANSSNDFVVAALTQDKDILFKGNDGGSTIEAMRIDMSEAGRVGIGVTAPSDKLTVGGITDPRIAVRMSSGGDNNTARMIVQTNGTASTNADAFTTYDNNAGSATGTKWMVGVDASATSFKIAAADLGNFDGTNEYLTVDSNGDLHLSASRFRIYTNATTGFSVSTPSNGNSIVDTDLTANEYGTYLISLYARPNPGGSSIYADNIVGVLSCVGSYDSGGLTYKIKFTELYNHSASSNTDITLSFVFHDGSGGESTLIANGSQTIRAKVGGQATGYEFSGARLIFYQLNAGSV